MKKKILISTGGSGGHVIPATIFYEHLKSKFDVFLSIDKRGIKFIKEDKYKIKIIDMPKLNLNLFFLPFNFFLTLFLIVKSLFFLKKNGINFLISTGGYMSLPLCIAAKFLNIKIYLFEPNMVLGRANRFFLKFSEKIFCYSDEIKNFKKKYIEKIVLIGPLLRKEFYSIKPDENIEIQDKINLLIIGGSQGAQLFDSKIKNAVVVLSKKYKLKVFQQISLTSSKSLEDFYIKNNIDNKLFEFSDDILQFITNSNLCITRAGASTLSELTFLNVPYITIPLPTAKDDHQLHNALFYKNKNCCWVLKEEALKQDAIANNLINIAKNKEDYSTKKKSMKNFSYQNTWDKINQKLIEIINEN